MSYKIWLLAGFLIIILIGVGAAYIMMKSSTSSSPSSVSTPVVFTSTGFIQSSAFIVTNSHFS
ncbi:hypothetical protein DDW01_01575 [Sulfolobus sp. SCGC AB-777_G05]|nr:hypothetical protein DDW01_01575 [Sulfolobus sp. SCGC AB-777_G05]